jgi:hypothetical protein
MSYRYYPNKGIQNSSVRRPISARVIGWFLILSTVGLLLLGGFVIGARKHFDAVDVGYESEMLRREANQLGERLRQLELEHDRVASPAEIERRAKKIGLHRQFMKPKAKDQKSAIRK